jgi:hypothetical protein
MSADVFTRRWIGLFALLAGLVAIAPYFIQVVVANSGCAAVSGRCAEATDVLSLYGRRLTLAVILIPLVLAIAMRALTVGAFLWAVPFALLMIAGASPMLLESAHYARMTSWTDLLALPALTPLMFLVLQLVALSAYPDDREGGTAGAWQAVLALVAVAALFVTAPLLVPGLASLPYVGQLALPAGAAVANAHAALGIADQLARFGTWCMVAFILCTAGLVVSGRGPAMATRPIRVSRA